MTIEIEGYTAPSTWAPYLINGDYSGMTDEEIAAADDFMEWVGLGDPVTCENRGFMRYHSARRFFPYAADCQEYFFHRVA